LLHQHVEGAHQLARWGGVVPEVHVQHLSYRIKRRMKQQ
jgi:hypothetical protein